MKRSISRYLVRNFRYRSCYVIEFYFVSRIVKVIKLKHHKRISDRVIKRISVHLRSDYFSSFILERRHGDSDRVSLNLKNTIGYYIDIFENTSYDYNPNIEILSFHEV